MPATHRVRFDEAEMKEAIKVGLKTYNLTDALESAYRLIKPKEILPPTAIAEKLKDGRDVVQVLSVDGKEAALQAIITQEIDTQGPLCHFVAGWLACKGLIDEIPEDERKQLEEVAQGKAPVSLLDKLRGRQ